ncbi:hypothetical protein AB4Z30_18730 [Paenibacillus sp. 2TAF8]|jgi:hypothetical protein|uniref:hypothetical protein n=1 Tax=Paenibacillus sp. 2TAF8 TaxID=3233020 RepID=UPI003F9DBBFB
MNRALKSGGILEKNQVGEALKRYIRTCGEFDDPDYMFDELYFLHILLCRYASELKQILTPMDYEKIVFRHACLGNTKELAQEITVCELGALPTYIQSQVLFRYLGTAYYRLISTGKRFDRSDEWVMLLKNNLSKVRGYSMIFDYMMHIFCTKLGIEAGSGLSPVTVYKSREESIYVDTHYFLVHSDYFKRPIMNDNIDRLLEGCEYALTHKLGDLVAELYWALNVYGYGDREVLKLKSFMDNFYMEGEWRYGYTDSRRQVHAQYSTIAAYLEFIRREQLRGGE